MPPLPLPPIKCCSRHYSEVKRAIRRMSISVEFLFAEFFKDSTRSIMRCRQQKEQHKSNKCHRHRAASDIWQIRQKGVLLHPFLQGRTRHYGRRGRFFYAVGALSSARLLPSPTIAAPAPACASTFSRHRVSRRGGQWRAGRPNGARLSCHLQYRQ